MQCWYTQQESHGETCIACRREQDRQSIPADIARANAAGPPVRASGSESSAAHPLAREHTEHLGGASMTGTGSAHAYECEAPFLDKHSQRHASGASKLPKDQQVRSSLGKTTDMRRGRPSSSSRRPALGIELD